MNRTFVEEWDQLVALADLYRRQADGATGAPAKAATRDRARETTHVSAPGQAWRIARARVSRRLLAWRDPIRRRLARGRCPDCSRPLVPAGSHAQCATCNVVFVGVDARRYDKGNDDLLDRNSHP